MNDSSKYEALQQRIKKFCDDRDWSQYFIWFDNDISETERRRFATALESQTFIEVNLRKNPYQLQEIVRDIL